MTIHQSAAYTIGRRGLGYKEKVPKVLKKYIIQNKTHHWSHWSILHKKLSVSSKSFYHLFNVNKPHQEINIHHSSLREQEIKQLLEALG